MSVLGLGIGLIRKHSSNIQILETVRNLQESHTQDSITVTWDAPLNQIPDSYLVQYSSGFNIWGNDQTVISPLTYTYSGLNPGVYFVRVRSVYSTGNSAWKVTNQIILGSSNNILGFFLL